MADDYETMRGGSGGSSELPEVEASESESFYIPKDALGGKECKPGDKLTLKVVAVDEETGEAEVRMSESAKAPELSMEDDLRQSLA